MKDSKTGLDFNPAEKHNNEFFEKQYIFKFPYTKEFIKITIHAESGERLVFMSDTLKRFIERVVHYMR